MKKKKTTGGAGPAISGPLSWARESRPLVAPCVRSFPANGQTLLAGEKWSGKAMPSPFVGNKWSNADAPFIDRRRTESIDKSLETTMVWFRRSSSRASAGSPGGRNSKSCHNQMAVNDAVVCSLPRPSSAFRLHKDHLCVQVFRYQNRCPSVRLISASI